MALVTDQCGRLIGYTCQELSAHTCEGVNALPYDVTRAIMSTTNAAASRKHKMNRAQTTVERVELEPYDKLTAALNNLDSAMDSLLSDLQ